MPSIAVPSQLPLILVAAAAGALAGSASTASRTATFVRASAR